MNLACIACVMLFVGTRAMVSAVSGKWMVLFTHHTIRSNLALGNNKVFEATFGVKISRVTYFPSATSRNSSCLYGARAAPKERGRRKDYKEDRCEGGGDCHRERERERERERMKDG